MKTALRYVALAVVVAACSATPTTTTNTVPTAVSTTFQADSSSTTAADAVSEHLEWFLSVINGAEVSAAEYEERFDDSFRAAMPYEESLLPIVTQLQGEGPYELGEINRRSTTGLDAIVTAADSTRLVVVLDIDQQDRIVGLLVQPADPPVLENPPQTIV